MPRPRIEFDKRQVQDMTKRYVEYGQSLLTISKFYNVSTILIRRILLEAGVTLKKSNRPKVKRTSVKTQEKLSKYGIDTKNNRVVRYRGETIIQYNPDWDVKKLRSLNLMIDEIAEIKGISRLEVASELGLHIL